MPAFANNCVNFAEVGQPGLDRVAQFVALADIGDPRHYPATESFDRPLGFGQIIRRRKRVRIRLDLAADVDGNDVGAFVCHRDRMSATLTTSRTGDERNFAVKPSGLRTSANP